MRKGIFAVLLLCLTVTLTWGARADEIDKAKQQLDSTKNNIDKYQKEIKNINKDKEAAEVDLKALSSEITELNNSIYALKSEADVLKSEIKATEDSLAQCEEDQKHQQELFYKRVRVLYTSGGTGYLEAVLSSKSLSEAIDRVQYLKTIIAHDKKLEQELLNTKKEITSKKEGLIAKQQRLEANKAELSTKKDSMDSKSAKQKQVITQLEKSKSSYEKLIAQEKEDSKALEAKIKKLMEDKQNSSSGGGQKPGGGTVVQGKLYCVTGKPYVITSPYGWRVHPVYGTSKFHSGLDIGVYSGTPLYSLTDGIVIFSGVQSGYGNIIMVSHGNIISVYAHCSKLVAAAGQQVKGGQLIAYSGNTGVSTGPHLHYEIRKTNGETTDPLPYYIR